jgi:hypothetical protein
MAPATEDLGQKKCRITFRLFTKFAAPAHTYPLVCLIYSIFLYYKELVKPYLPTVTHDISYLFTKIDVIFDNIISDFGLYAYLNNIRYA